MITGPVRLGETVSVLTDNSLVGRVIEIKKFFYSPIGALNSYTYLIKTTEGPIFVSGAFLRLRNPRQISNKVTYDPGDLVQSGGVRGRIVGSRMNGETQYHQILSLDAIAFRDRFVARLTAQVRRAEHEIRTNYTHMLDVQSLAREEQGQYAVTDATIESYIRQHAWDMIDPDGSKDAKRRAIEKTGTIAWEPCENIVLLERHHINKTIRPFVYVQTQEIA